MKKGEIYKIPHKCFIAQWSSEDDGGFEIFGGPVIDAHLRFDNVYDIAGFRCIALVERVRNHWVVDTWIDTEEGGTREKTSLLSHKYLCSLIKRLPVSGEVAIE